MSNQPRQSSLNSRYNRSRGLTPKSRRLSRFLLLSALALLAGVFSACGSSDSGEDVEREAAAPPPRCVSEGPGADWSDCDRSDANLIAAYLSGANLSGANLDYANLSGADLIDTNLTGAKLPQAPMCSNGTVWPDGTTGQGSKCPPTN